MKDPYPVHGRRRRWGALWTVGCRCGMNAYPCIVERTVEALRKDAPRHAAETYPGSLRVAGFRDPDRRGWSGGPR